MMRFNNKSGFLLLEALLAIAIVGMMLIPALSLLASTMERMNQHLFAFRRLFFAQQFLVEMGRKHGNGTKKVTETKKEQKPATDLTFQFGPVDQKSGLVEFEGIYKEEVVARGRKDEPPVRLIQFVYRPSEPKEEK